MEKAYLSFDIEADGQSVLTNSMLSLGIVLITKKGEVLDELEVHIDRRDGAEEDPDTMEWWATQPDAWEWCHTNAVSPEEAMSQVAEFYQKWNQKYKLKWVAMPAAWDWMFLKSYFCAFGPSDIDIGFKAICLSSVRDAAIKMKGWTWDHYEELCAEWTADCEKKSHKAVEDARYQGKIFINLRKVM